MRSKLLPLFIMGAFLLAACTGPKPTASTVDLSGPPMDHCTVKQLVPDPNPTIEAMLPPISDSDHVMGSKQAKVTIIEYSDYQ